MDNNTQADELSFADETGDETGGASSAANAGQATSATADEVYNIQVMGLRKAYGEDINVVKRTFNFRTQKKDTGEKDEAGNPIIISTKRAGVTVPLITPSQKRIIELLNATGPARDLIYTALENVAYDAGYELVANDPTITSVTFPLDQLDWDAIAARAAAAGTSRGLNMDDLKLFAEDYKACMEEISGRPQIAVKNAADAFLQRFSKHRTSQKILSTLNSHLNLYIEKAPNAELYADVVQWLKAKLEELLAASSDELYLL